MAHPLYTHINKYIALNQQSFLEVYSYFETQSLGKKESIIHIDKRCNTLVFVIKGCLHQYYINEKGIEQTVQFGIENWWITDALAFFNQSNSSFNIRAVEKSEILSITYTKQQALLKKFPEMEKYFRSIYQIAYGAAIMRFKYFFEYSKEEIYFYFKELNPEFVKRVPQYLLATYLGLTPEYLSEIKNKGFS